MFIDFKNRALPERSFLYFVYPSRSATEINEGYLPMLENPNITESQKARLNAIDLLGRSGNLFTFQGARSRSFNLTFRMTLEHIRHYIHEVGLPSLSVLLTNNGNAKQLFKLNPNKNSNNKITNYSYDYNKNVSFDSGGQRDPGVDEIDVLGKKMKIIGGGKWMAEIKDPVFNPNPNKQALSTDDAINYLMYFLNIVRTSTIGNSTDTSLGPPTIYLNHGGMYNNIPCVCDNFNIKILDNVPYDVDTLIPKVIEVSMVLHENRTGNFGNFIPFKQVEGENLAGWECFLEYNTMDPHGAKNRLGL